MTAHFDSPLWVVTSYFNPSKYKRRLENFHTFRRFLNAPLLVVELERDGEFQLTQDDGEIVIQLTGEDRIWQKERLINIGIENLPDHVKYVAWVDCDVIFEDADWVQDAIQHLENHEGLLQLYDLVADLGEESSSRARVEPAFQLEYIRKRFSAIYAIHEGYQEQFKTGIIPELATVGAGPQGIRPSRGFAWAAQRRAIEKLGLYDKNILGSGDWIALLPIEKKLACGPGPVGWAEAHLADIDQHLAQAHTQKLYSNLAYLKRTIFHLWHGSLKNRHYLDRAAILSQHNFDPAKDLRISDNGTWQWSNPDSPLAKDVAAYFDTRREDG